MKITCECGNEMEKEIKFKMTFKKQFKKQPQQESQIIWKNQVHDAKFNPWKVYYACVKIGNQSYVYQYESKFRSEAKAYFDEMARVDGGFVETIGVLK